MKHSRHARIWWYFGTREVAERTVARHTPQARGKTVLNFTSTILDVPNSRCPTRVRLEIEYDYTVTGNAEYDIKRFAREATRRAEATPVHGPEFDISDRRAEAA